MSGFLRAAPIAAILALLPGPPAGNAPPPPPPNAPSAQDAPGLHNVVAFGPGLWSGSVPEGDDGFATLRRWGVRTIISVDGAEPDLERARMHGIRYVHLPIGYNGFDQARRLQLARAVRDLPGPVYLHCHHGKHRSAGAAGAVAVTLGWMSPEAAVARMRVSGTAPGYANLYACTAEARPAAPGSLDAVPAEFPAVTRPRGIVEAMVAVDMANDHLKLVERAGWKAPADHPDLVPSAEAGALADHLRLLTESPESRSRPAAYAGLMRAAQASASRLESGLAARPAADPAALSAEFKVLQASCKDCHAAYRDAEKPRPAER